MILNLPDEKILLIEPDIFQVLNSYRQCTVLDKEAGGILIGEYRGDHLRIVSLTTPGKSDIQGKFMFYRKSLHHQSQARRDWVASNHVQTWLGEWHTHPEDNPRPSSMDVKNWKKNFPKRPMVTIIQGRLSLWFGFFDGFNLIELKLN